MTDCYIGENDPSSNHFVVPLTGSAGQRTLRRQALSIKIKTIPLIPQAPIPAKAVLWSRLCKAAFDALEWLRLMLWKRVPFQQSFRGAGDRLRRSANVAP